MMKRQGLLLMFIVLGLCMLGVGQANANVADKR